MINQCLVMQTSSKIISKTDNVFSKNCSLGVHKEIDNNARVFRIQREVKIFLKIKFTRTS